MPRIIATNGCFDILHAGHVSYLKRAAQLGDQLIVGINSDASVRQLKGPTRPINNQEDRCRVVQALRCVHKAFIFEGTRATDFLSWLKPDIWVKGGDYTLESLDPDEVNAVRAYGGDIMILPLLVGYSTTSILAKLS